MQIDWFVGILGCCIGCLVTVAVNNRLQEQQATIDALNDALERLREARMAPRHELQAAISLHGHWDWSRITYDLLQPFKQITPRMLDAAVASCYDNGTMYCQRLQIHKGSLYLTDYRAIFFDRYYAPARIMPILETLRRHPDLPDMDLVVAANDEPRIKTLVDSKFWTRLCARYPGDQSNAGPLRGELPPPLFSSTINVRALLCAVPLPFGRRILG